MPPAIATLICLTGIAGLFWLGRDRKAPTSAALWIPVLWVSLACSRSAGQWLSPSRGANQSATPEQVLDGSPADRLVFTVLLLVGLIVLLSRGKQVWSFLRANGPVLIFFLYCVVSIAWSDYPGVSFKRWIKAFGDLVMILLVLSDRNLYGAIKRFLSRPTFVLIPLSILFIKYYPEIGTAYGPWGGASTNTGVTTNKNTLGVICLLFGLGSLWQILNTYQDRESDGRTRRLIAHGVILAMVAWLFWKANSMTSLSCFLMAGTLLIVTSLRVVSRRPMIVHFIIAAMLAVSASIVFLDVSPGVLETMGRNPTLTDRTEVWGWLFSLVRNPILGTGFDSFWLGPRLEKMWSIYWWHPNEAHNGYIEIYLNLGWIGLMLLALVLVAGYRKIINSYRQHLPLANLCLAYFLVGITYNFTEAAFFKMLAPAWIFCLFAIVSAPAVSQFKFKEPTKYPAVTTWKPAGSTFSKGIS